jgi:adenosine deaminase
MYSQLKKVELHRHLELTLKKSTVVEWVAADRGIQLNNQQYDDQFLILEPMGDLGSVLSKFLGVQKLLDRPARLQRLAYEAVENAYLNENIRVLELRYAPTFLTQDSSKFLANHQAIVAGVKAAQQKYPIAVGLIGIIQRILSVDIAANVIDFAIDHKDTFVALDLADNEEGFDSKPFAPHFLRGKKNGLKVTIHAGELPIDKSPKFVKEAVDILGADRIGHGLHVYRNPAIAKEMKDRNILLELCPTSNVLTGSVKSIKEHPIRILQEMGVPFSVNTDDPSIFNTDLNIEYGLLNKHLGFTNAEFEKINQLAAKHSFIPASEVAKAWN